MLAILLSWHSWGKKWYWGPVKIEFCGNTNFVLLGLISKNFTILFSLQIHMTATMYRFGTGNVTIWICKNFTRFFSALHGVFHALSTAFGGRLASCIWTSESIWVRTSWDDHSRVSITLLDALIIHNVLWEVTFFYALTVRVSELEIVLLDDAGLG